MNVNLNANLSSITEYEAFCQQFDLISLEPVVELLDQLQNWTAQQLEQSMTRYKQLLFLVQRYPNECIVPDQVTDQVVHAHLSFKEQHHQDCQTLFGTPLEHESGFGTRGDADRLDWLRAFERTKTLLQKHFHWTDLESLKPAYCVVKLAA